MSAIDSEATLGEMAHIVARSLDGPRGQSPLNATERDAYSNLILLCPNHHEQVDGDEHSFAIERLHEIKSEHEAWVQKMLEAGQILPTELDTSAFINERVRRLAINPTEAWPMVSLTPLALAQDVVDPLRDGTTAVLTSHKFPDYLAAPLGRSPNRYHIEPNSTGLVAEDFRHVTKGVGYRIECHRTGYLQYSVLLNEPMSRVPPQELNEPHWRRLRGINLNRRETCEKVLLYSILADTVIRQIQLLLDLWRDAERPFLDMSLTLALTGIRRTCLVVTEKNNAWIGRPVDEDVITFTEVISNGTLFQEAARSFFRRMANSFGLELLEPFSPTGELANPVLFTDSKRNLPLA